MTWYGRRLLRGLKVFCSPYDVDEVISRTWDILPPQVCMSEGAGTELGLAGCCGLKRGSEP